MLVPETCALLQVKVVCNIAEAPDNIAALAIDLVQRGGTAGRDQIGAIIILLDTVAARRVRWICSDR